MNNLGRHILSEIYGCDESILNDKEYIERIMVESALKSWCRSKRGCLP